MAARTNLDTALHQELPRLVNEASPFSDQPLAGPVKGLKVELLLRLNRHK